jgi:hypothetical protein
VSASYPTPHFRTLTLGVDPAGPLDAATKQYVDSVPGVPGAAGPPGPTGPTGATGAAGPPGASGPAGPSAVSTDAGNTATLGTDSLIFVPASGGSGGNEVSISAGDPGATFELWYDTDATPPAPALWQQMTQAGYDALPTKDPNTLYVVVG